MGRAGSQELEDGSTLCSSRICFDEGSVAITLPSPSYASCTNQMLLSHLSLDQDVSLPDKPRRVGESYLRTSCCVRRCISSFKTIFSSCRCFEVRCCESCLGVG